MSILRVLVVTVVMMAVTLANHTKDHKSELRSTLDLFTQLEPDILQWWFQRTENGMGDLKPIVPTLTHLLSTRLLGHDCTSLDQCILKRLYNGPIFIITKDEVKPDELTAFYSEKGLNTVFKDDLYKGATDFLRSTEPKTALLMNSKKIYNFKMANKPISKIVTPLDFKLSDLDALSKIGDQIPLLFVTNNEEFKDFKFTYVHHYGKFNVFDDGIEPEIK